MLFHFCVLWDAKCSGKKMAASIRVHKCENETKTIEMNNHRSRDRPTIAFHFFLSISKSVLVRCNFSNAPKIEHNSRFWWQKHWTVDGRKRQSKRERHKSCCLCSLNAWLNKCLAIQHVVNGQSTHSNATNVLQTRALATKSIESWQHCVNAICKIRTFFNDINFANRTSTMNWHVFMLHLADPKIQYFCWRKPVQKKKLVLSWILIVIVYLFRSIFRTGKIKVLGKSQRSFWHNFTVFTIALFHLFCTLFFCFRWRNDLYISTQLHYVQRHNTSHYISRKTK